MDKVEKQVRDILHAYPGMEIPLREWEAPGGSYRVVSQFIALFDQQKQELLDALTIELKDWECVVPAKPTIEGWMSQDKMEQLFAHIGRTNYNKALKDVVDELEARKQKILHRND